MESSVCVLKVLSEMRGWGVCGSALIKKRRFWPREVHGDGINDYFRSKNIDDVGCPSGEWNEKEFNTFVLKEPCMGGILLREGII